MQKAALSTGRDYSKKTNNANSAIHCTKLGRKKTKELATSFLHYSKKKGNYQPKKDELFKGLEIRFLLLINVICSPFFTHTFFYTHTVIHIRYLSISVSLAFFASLSRFHWLYLFFSPFALSLFHLIVQSLLFSRFFSLSILSCGLDGALS